MSKIMFLFFRKKIKINKKGPKLRSGVFAIHRDDFIKVNGFDEKNTKVGGMKTMI
ncbi:MAG: hypothetical protein H6613_10880 [Ignavibacteriales bacterium]|nr:hypothetical protein [Ignavibacteriales bacterium]